MWGLFKKWQVWMFLVGGIVVISTFLVAGKTVYKGEVVSYLDVATRLLLGDNGVTDISESPINSVISSSADVTERLQIMNSTYIDSYFGWTFTKINTSWWNASFVIDRDFWGNASICINTNGASKKTQCFTEFCNTWLSEWLNCTQQSANKVNDDLLNLANYPLLNLSGSIAFLGKQIDKNNGTGSFIIQFPEGFNENSLMKFGYNSTIVASTAGNPPFTIKKRAICRTDNAVHVVWKNDGHIMYSNSTDEGDTWSTPYQIDGGTNDVPASSPAMDCSGTKIFIAWMDSDSRADLDYRNSSDEGASWSPLISGSAPIWRDGTGSGAYVIDSGNVAYGIGWNIWVSYLWDGGTPETAILDNSSVYTGNTPTVTRKDMGIDVSASANYAPTLLVNNSGTSEQVFLAFQSAAGTSSIHLNRSMDGGTTWLGSSPCCSGGGSNWDVSLTLLKDEFLIQKGGYRYNTTNYATWLETATQYGYGSAASDGTNIYVIGTSSVAPFDIRRTLWNVSSTPNVVVLANPASANDTVPNVKWNASNDMIEYVYVANASINYGKIYVGRGRIDFKNMSINDSGYKFEGSSNVTFATNVSATVGTLSWGFFGWNATSNCGGGWSNITNWSLSGSAGLNVSRILPVGCAGKNVAYRFYVNNSYSVFGNSGGNFDVYKYGYLNVTWSLSGSDINNTCNSTSPCGWANNTLKNASATVMCSGGAGALCGQITTGIRYNKTTTNPNEFVNTTSGAIPFFIPGSDAASGTICEDMPDLADARVWEFAPTTNYAAFTSMSIGLVTGGRMRDFILFATNTSYPIKILRNTTLSLNKTTTAGTAFPRLGNATNTSNDWLETTITWNNQPSLGSFQNATLLSGGAGYGATRYNWTVNEAFNASSASNSNLSIVITDGPEDNASAQSDFQTKESAVSNNGPRLTICYDYGSSASNLITIPELGNGGSYTINYSVNATDNSSFPRVLDVYFNSSYGSTVPDNDTLDAFYGQVVAGGVSDNNATLILSLSAQNYSVTNASNLTINVSVLASGGNGHQINISLWNASSTNPSYNNLTTNLTCASFLSTGQSCSVNISINMSAWSPRINNSLHFNVTSNNSFVLPKWTDSFWINLTDAATNSCTPVPTWIITDECWLTTEAKVTTVYTAGSGKLHVGTGGSIKASSCHFKTGTLSIISGAEIRCQ